jgi:ABC-type long-subunit fatty acid transport system fused permease/ATPase subunit
MALYTIACLSFHKSQESIIITFILSQENSTHLTSQYTFHWRIVVRGIFLWQENSRSRSTVGLGAVREQTKHVRIAKTYTCLHAVLILACMHIVLACILPLTLY